jgi:hypothetical protein
MRTVVVFIFAGSMVLAQETSKPLTINQRLNLDQDRDIKRHESDISALKAHNVQVDAQIKDLQDDFKMVKQLAYGTEAQSKQDHENLTLAFSLVRWIGGGIIFVIGLLVSEIIRRLAGRIPH